MKIITIENKEVLRKYFINSVRNNDISKVRYCINQGVDVNYDNDRALRIACWNENFGIIEYLLDNGANIQVGNGWVLRIACLFGQLEIVKRCVRESCDIYAKDRLAIIYAKHHPEVLEYLESLIDEDNKNL